MLVEMIRRIGMKETGEPLSVTFVGAGGKTSCMLLLSEELRKEGKNHIITTTTQIELPGNEHYDQLILTGNRTNDLMEERMGTIKGAFPMLPKKNQGCRVLVGKELTEEGKLRGISKAEYDALQEMNPKYWMLNEGDGAKRKSIKAPRHNEPVIPLKTHVVIGMVGLRVLDQEINEASVHRVDEFLRITGKKRDDRITKEDLLALIADPEGVFKDVPREAGKILLLNQGEEEGLRKAGQEILQESRCSGGVLSVQRNTLYYRKEESNVL